MKVVCQVLDVPPSSYHYQSVERDEQPLKTAIAELAAEWSLEGYRCVIQRLQRTG